MCFDGHIVVGVKAEVRRWSLGQGAVTLTASGWRYSFKTALNKEASLPAAAECVLRQRSGPVSLAFTSFCCFSSLL